MSDCLFCKIAAGDIPCYKVWEDDTTLAFLDINPLARGHALVIPKAHGAKLADLPPAHAAALMATTQRLSPALCAAVDAPDATLAVNDGPAAGQEIPHVHLHIVPRRPGDQAGPVHALFKERPEMDGDELAELATSVMQTVTA